MREHSVELEAPAKRLVLYVGMRFLIEIYIVKC
jgi:hypothetical protein